MWSGCGAHVGCWWEQTLAPRVGGVSGWRSFLHQTRAVLQLGLGALSWEPSLETHFPPLLPSERYFFNKLLWLNPDVLLAPKDRVDTAG